MTLRHWIYGVPLILSLAIPGVASAQFSVSVNIAPPELPVYEQPPIPADGYLWTPGYWAWSDDDQDYYWVPGTWVEAPETGYLWTPGWWGADGAAFLWHAGYWGPQVGFYGGVNYGYGYTGNGYQGGYWQGGHVYYNRDASNIGTAHITNVYNKTVINNNVTINRVSYNGGNGGIRAQPSAAQQAAAQTRHVSETPVQRQQQQTASGNQSLRASVNHGSPPIAATARPGAFSGGGVVAARHTGTLSVVGATPRPASPARPAAQTRPNEAYRSPGEPAQTPQRAPTSRPEAPTSRPEAPTSRPEAPSPRPEAPAPHPEARSPENVQQRQAPRPEPKQAQPPRQPERPSERPPEH